MPKSNINFLFSHFCQLAPIGEGGGAGFKGEQCDSLHGDKAHSVPLFGELRFPSMHLSRPVSHAARWPEGDVREREERIR